VHRSWTCFAPNKQMGQWEMGQKGGLWLAIVLR